MLSQALVSTKYSGSLWPIVVQVQVQRTCSVFCSQNHFGGFYLTVSTEGNLDTLPNRDDDSHNAADGKEQPWGCVQELTTDRVAVHTEAGLPGNSENEETVAKINGYDPADDGDNLENVIKYENQTLVLVCDWYVSHTIVRPYPHIVSTLIQRGRLYLSFFSSFCDFIL
jgi:hypothetical protein